MRKADKLFQLTNILRARQPITADQLAQELGVSVRTVYRYIDDLSVSGIPIFGTTGLGYQLHEKFELPPLNLTEGELSALMLGVRMVSSWTGDELAESAKLLAKKIEAALPEKMRDDYSDVVFAPESNHSNSNRKVWEGLHNAIKKSAVVDIQYCALDGSESSRSVYPLGLVYWGGKWTLAAWCTNKQDFRNFRIDKIVDFSVLDTLFGTTQQICLEAFMANIKQR